MVSLAAIVGRCLDEILVVEDDRSFAANLQLAIESAGFECDVAHDGAVAVERVADGEYDLVVLDVMLPGLKRGTCPVDTSPCDSIASRAMLSSGR